MRQSIRTSTGLLNYYLKAPYAMHVRRGAPDLLRVLNEGAGGVYTAVVLGSVSAATEAITLLALTVTLLVVNPLAPILTAWSQVLHSGHAPAGWTLLVGGAWAVAIFVIENQGNWSSVVAARGPARSASPTAPATCWASTTSRS